MFHSWRKELKSKIKNLQNKTENKKRMPLVFISENNVKILAYVVLGYGIYVNCSEWWFQYWMANPLKALQYDTALSPCPLLLTLLMPGHRPLVH